MAKPADQTTDARMRDLANEVRRSRTHTHPGIVTDPATITGPRSDTAAILGQLLDALAADGIIIDETTD